MRRHLLPNIEPAALFSSLLIDTVSQSRFPKFTAGATVFLFGPSQPHSKPGDSTLLNYIEIPSRSAQSSCSRRFKFRARNICSTATVTFFSFKCSKFQLNFAIQYTLSESRFCTNLEQQHTVYHPASLRARPGFESPWARLTKTLFFYFLCLFSEKFQIWTKLDYCCIIHNFNSTIPNSTNDMSILIRKMRGIQILHSHASLASSLNCLN
jgi:hypothetical protein